MRVEKAAIIIRIGLGALEVFLPYSYYRLRPWYILIATRPYLRVPIQLAVFGLDRMRFYE